MRTSFSTLRRLFCVALLGTSCLLRTAPVGADPALEEVLVTGTQPGPGLWKVTRPGAAADDGGHVLWILGSYSPLPKKMQWRSQEVRSVLAGSQEVLAPVAVSAAVGPLGGVTLLPSLIGVKRNPNDARLQDVLPADLYSRWLPLKTRYLGDDRGVEKWRPIFAAQELYLAALKSKGLVPYEGVWPSVEKMARQANVKITRPELELEVAKPRAAIKEFKQMPLPDVECFARTIQRLESDLDLMRARANAWSAGDVATLRRLAPVERASACIGSFLESSFIQERGYGDVLERVRDTWVAAAERSFARSASTLAVLPIDEILKPDGYVAHLRARGYTIEDP